MPTLPQRQCGIRSCTLRPRVALGPPPQSLGADGHAESKETEIQTPLEMDSDRARGFAHHPGDAGGGNAIRRSAGDVADVDRAGRRDVLEGAETSASLPLDRSAADSGDVSGAPLDFGRSAILSARGI